MGLMPHHKTPDSGVAWWMCANSVHATSGIDAHEQLRLTTHFGRCSGAYSGLLGPP